MVTTSKLGFIFLSASVFSLTSTHAYSLTGSGDSDEIIVEGLRIPTRIAETGTSVSVITAEDIELRAYAFALDAIAGVPGVTINQTGTFGGLATVQIRGASTDQTLVLLDGVPIGDPTAVGGGYDFSIIDAADIERIEILKGPQSTLWGSDAIGGVVNIITKRPADGLSGRLFAEGGSYETFRGGGAIAHGGERGDFRLSATGITTDGISKADENDGNTEKDGYDGYSLAAHGGFNLARSWRLEALARQMSGRTEIDGFPPPVFTLADTDDWSKTQQFISAAKLNAPFLNGRFNNTFMAGYTDIKRTGNFGGFKTKDNGDRLILRYQGAFTLNDKNQIAFGAERETNEANGEETSINGLFGLYELKPVEDLTLTAGIRYDDHNEFGSETTGRFSAAWSPIDFLTFRGSWGEGFKSPTIFQLTQSFGLLPPNRNLLPETSRAFDAGADISILERRAKFSVTYFNRDTKNQIIFAPNFRYENLEATKAQGIEIATSATLVDFLTLSVNYAYIDSKDKITGEPLIRTPRHSGNASLIYNDDGPFSGTVTVIYNGDETEGFFGSDLEDWVRVDLAASYALNDTVEFYCRIENLFDVEYQHVSGYGTPGLSGYGGVRITF
jgi:vitamin B12 transporter